ncbi:EAL and HDOD domain-containing protein [Polaromonas sp.]|uniref:EAL and HDOD domain-containing protein n=1 Tax=Polaromonas sp. TaxID=1869339 RepID=UPI003CAB9F50
MASDNRYLFRAPLLDSEQRVIGYKLACQKNPQDNEFSEEASSHQLLALLPEHAGETRSGRFFLQVSPVARFAEELAALLPQATVLILKQADLMDEGNRAMLASLRERGLGLALQDADPVFLEPRANEALLSLLSHVLVAFDHPQRAAIISLARQRQPPLAVVVDKVPGWPELAACAGTGVSGIFADICRAPREIRQPVKLGPQAQQILQLMHMVQGNADIRHVEKVLKSDVTLSYKLLRYINSAGFGLEVEIESPRHAVAMLGYAPLFRWLLLLLTRTHATGFSPALMQAAMIRGRFAELLGQGFLSRREAENLFVVGMFSFLDRLLGIPVKEVLSQLTLPETVAEALLAREGVYAPVLTLAEACESEDGRTADFAAALSMKAEDVNHAHLAALAWAQNIKI